MKILQPTDGAILEAVEALQAGKLIGFPTETVYGIAAMATNRTAVLATFALKARPAENPLIVHIADFAQVQEIVTSIPDSARRLAQAFWPGPLTLVLPKQAIVPDEATGGLDTVAVRVPRHPVALAILQVIGEPLTAPSANAFMGLSPTQADHIAPEIMSGLACVIDGGPCDVGIESTVVDCSGGEPMILRPGGISRGMIELVVGPVRLGFGAPSHRSPGQYKRHYSPKTPIRLVDYLGPTDAGLGFSAPFNSRQIQMPTDPDHYARELYSALYALDQLGGSEILVETPLRIPEWEAVWDRLSKGICGL